MLMKINNQFKEAIEIATGKALATIGPDGVNVVPVSVVKVNEDSIFLYDFFMQKTAENIKDNSEVSLAVWNGLSGIQIKGHMRYQSGGEIFIKEEKEMQKQFPDRKLRGLLILEPTEIYDVTAEASIAGKRLE